MKRLFWGGLIVFSGFISSSSCQAETERISPLFNCSKRLDNPYGICSHINRTGNFYEFDTREQEMKIITSLGASYIRTDFDWNICQQDEGGTFSYEQHDVMMSTINGKVNVLGILTPSTPRRPLNNWNVYIEKTVNHYKDLIHCWEIINEANLVNRRIPDFSCIEYVSMLKTAYKTIKKFSPSAYVLYSGLSDFSDGYYEKSLDYGAGDFFDIMNVHGYANKETEPEDLIKRMKLLREIMSKYNLNKKVWLSETGCSSVSHWASEDIQNKRLPRIFLVSFALGVEKVFWYKTRSNELKENDSECHYGLCHNNYSPKPAFYAYQALVKMCPNGSTRPIMKRQGDIYSATWKRPDGKNVWALWTSKSEEEIDLKIKGKYKIYDLKGNEICQDGNVFNVSPSVIYIVGAKYLQMVN